MIASLCFDLFSGLGGWSEGFLAEGWRVIGFDIERHRYPSRAIPEGHVKAPGADWNRSDSFNGTTEKRPRESPLTGGWDEYPGQLVLQDVLTIHGSQFRDAACIVASPPCQEFSYQAMPWKRAKAISAALRGHGEFPEGYTGSRTISELTALFDACFRIQREASEAAARWIPMVVENVKGAQPWVGKAKAAFGSFYLWGDVESIGGRVVASRRIQFGVDSTRAYRAGRKCPGNDTFKITGQPYGKFTDPKYPSGGLAQKITGYSDPRRNGGKGAHLTCQVENDRRLEDGRKVPMNFHEYEQTGKPGRSFQSAAVDGLKGAESRLSYTSSRSSARKAASAQIAKIPIELASYIARAFKPEPKEQVA